MNKHKVAQISFICQAALEYLISIIVSGSFLATIAKALGMTDSLTGVISSFISLGCLFQLVSLFLHPKREKTFIVIMSILNQLLFAALYVIPLANGSLPTKRAMFVMAIFGAYIIYYIAHPKKFTWLMSNIEDEHRGTFTANKEIISLITGIIFQYAMSAVIDRFIESGNTQTAFIISAVVISVTMLLHTVCLVITPSNDHEAHKVDMLKAFSAISGNKKVLKACLINVIYYIANYISLPFFSVYYINTLGFSLTTIFIIGMLSSISRIFASRFLGKYADKKGFAALLEKCFIICGISILCFAFAAPNTNKALTFIPIILYTLLHGISMGGINSGLSNIIFDYAPKHARSDALALSQAISGLVGFLATLAVSPLVGFIQDNGNTLFGIPIYAQQLLAIISAIMFLFLSLYIKFRVKNK
ncbi:MAG: MFS transporter [Clostridia bacterium]|nr:MFS transporter [Clostridia bacterium]